MKRSWTSLAICVVALASIALLASPKPSQDFVELYPGSLSKQDLLLVGTALDGLAASYRVNNSGDGFLVPRSAKANLQAEMVGQGLPTGFGYAFRAKGRYFGWRAESFTETLSIALRTSELEFLDPADPTPILRIPSAAHLNPTDIEEVYRLYWICFPERPCEKLRVELEGHPRGPGLVSIQSLALAQFSESTRLQEKLQKKLDRVMPGKAVAKASVSIDFQDQEEAFLALLPDLEHQVESYVPSKGSTLRVSRLSIDLRTDGIEESMIEQLIRFAEDGIGVDEARGDSIRVDNRKWPEL